MLVAAEKVVNGEPMCSNCFNGKPIKPRLAGSVKLPPPPVEPLHPKGNGRMENCKCGKPLHHRGRCIGYSAKQPKVAPKTKLHGGDPLICAAIEDLTAQRDKLNRVIEQLQDLK